jgi:hypothetical protein
VKQSELALKTYLLLDDGVPIRFKMLAYYRVRSAFEPNRALSSSKIWAFKASSIY